MTTPPVRPDIDIPRAMILIQGLATNARELAERVKSMEDLHTEQRLDLRVLEMSRTIMRIAKSVEKSKSEEEDRVRTDPWNWATMTAEEAAEAWTTLISWRSDVLKVRWPAAYEEMQAPCWYRHPDVVEELSSLWCSWMLSYVDTDKSAMKVADFLDRRLHLAVPRIVGLLRQCEIAGHKPQKFRKADHDETELETFWQADCAARPPAPQS